MPPRPTVAPPPPPRPSSAVVRARGCASNDTATAALPRSSVSGTLVSPRGGVIRTAEGGEGGARRPQSVRSAATTPARSSAPCPDLSPQLALLGAPLQFLSLVVLLLRLGESDRHLRDAVLEVQLERDDGQSLAAGGADELADLARVQQQLTGAGGWGVIVAAGEVGRDRHPREPDLPVPHLRVGFAEARLPRAERLDLRAGEHH